MQGNHFINQFLFTIYIVYTRAKAFKYYFPEQGICNLTLMASILWIVEQQKNFIRSHSIGSYTLDHNANKIQQRDTIKHCVVAFIIN